MEFLSEKIADAMAETYRMNANDIGLLIDTFEDICKKLTFFAPYDEDNNILIMNDNFLPLFSNKKYLKDFMNEYDYKNLKLKQTKLVKSAKLNITDLIINPTEEDLLLSADVIDYCGSFSMNSSIIEDIIYFIYNFLIFVDFLVPLKEDGELITEDNSIHLFLDESAMEKFFSNNTIKFKKLPLAELENIFVKDFVLHNSRGKISMKRDDLRNVLDICHVNIMGNLFYDNHNIPIHKIEIGKLTPTESLNELNQIILNGDSIEHNKSIILNSVYFFLFSNDNIFKLIEEDTCFIPIFTKPYYYLKWKRNNSSNVSTFVEVTTLQDFINNTDIGDCKFIINPSFDDIIINNPV